MKILDVAIRSSRAPGLAILCALVAPRETVAESPEAVRPRIEVTESTGLAWHGDPGNGDASRAFFGEFVSRLNTRAEWGAWSVALRLDSSAWGSTPQTGDRLARPGQDVSAAQPLSASTLRGRYEDHLVDPSKGIEKLSLQYRGRMFEATLGDVYAQFGRGLTLSLRKLDELGQDTTLLGGQTIVRTGAFTATLLAGVTNTQNLDPATGRYLNDPRDRIAAGRAEWRWGRAKTGLHVVTGQPATNASALAIKPDRITRTGLTFDAPRLTDRLGLYAEYALRADRLTDEAVPGHATYAAVTLADGPTTWTLEGKDYRRYAVWTASNDPLKATAYMQPPTLERVIMPLSTNSDTTAARLRWDRAFGPKASLTTTFEIGRLAPTADARHRLLDGTLEGRLFGDEGGTHLFGLLSLRDETDVVTGEREERLVSIESDGGKALSDGWSVEAQELVWVRSKPALGEWEEGQAAVALKKASKLALTAGYEFTTLASEQQNRHHFGNVAVLWYLSSASSVRLFAGSQRPGLRCVSGLCRQFPAFNGVRLEFVLRG